MADGSNTSSFSTIKFSYTPPVLQRDKTCLIESSSSAPRPRDKPTAAIIAKNSEISAKYSQSGETMPEEDGQLQYHRMQSKAKWFVGRPGEEQMFNASFWDEQVTSEDEMAWNDMDRSNLECLLSKRGGGKESRTDVRWAYRLGFSVDPSQTSI
ncbi:hypothetical protein ACEPPN_006230 [Leptodophora sp. 'Broadleaf-Isolate-01']